MQNHPCVYFSVVLYSAMKIGLGSAVKSVHCVKSTAILHFCLSIPNATLQVAGAYNLCGVLLIIEDTVKGKQSDSTPAAAVRAEARLSVSHPITK